MNQVEGFPIPALQVGDTVWIYSENSRVYPEAGGGVGAGPIYRYKWTAYEIVGENRASWLLDAGGGKVPKRPNTDRRRYVCYSKDELDARCWIETNSRALVEHIKNLTYGSNNMVSSTVYLMLRTAAATLEFTEQPEPKPRRRY
jgi:hypothetical protein